jgi:hypothetical protein
MAFKNNIADKKGFEKGMSQRALRAFFGCFSPEY